MERIQPNNRPGFRQLERQLTIVIGGLCALFLLMLLFAAFGVSWLKWILAILVMAGSALGFALLVLKQEHRRKRSHWLLCAFGALFLCTLVSVLVGYPAPPAQ